MQRGSRMRLATLAVTLTTVMGALLAPAASAVASACTGTVGAGLTVNCLPGSQAYTSIVVPAHVSSVLVTAVGGGGGGNAAASGAAFGGAGASVTAQIPVTPGQTLKVYVATGGGAGVGSYVNVGGTGYGTGGNGGAYYGDGFGGGYGGGGGGSTALLVGDTVTVVAGGGGGGGGDAIATGGRHWGGHGGTAIGQSGHGDVSDSCAVGGRGGNADGAGAAGTSPGTGVSLPAATSGYQGRGGGGSFGAGGSNSGGGGGGAGYGGGGGGNWKGPYGCFYAGGGGGGGSYVIASGTSVSMSSASNGAQSAVAGGDGSMAITFIAAPPTVPSTPQSMIFTDRTANSMTVNWSPPSDDGGASITGYVITMTPGAGNAATSTSTTTSPVFQATGLASSTSYTFDVTAVNAVGQSASALSGTESTTAPLNAPPSPTNLVFETVTSSSVTLRWSPPTDATSVTGYNVRVGSGSLTFVSASGDLRYTASQLAAGTQYAFKVYSQNVAGLSVPLAGVETTTTTVPTRVRNPQVVSASSTSSSLTVTWTAPLSDGGTPVLDYLVTVDSRSPVTVWSQTLSYTATDLTPGASHTFVFAARNANGVSDTATATGQTLAATPALQVPNGLVGTPHVVTLTNFTPNAVETVTVLAPSGASTIRTVTVGGNGSVSATFTETEAGSYTVSTSPTATSASFMVETPPVVQTPPPPPVDPMIPITSPTLVREGASVTCRIGEYSQDATYVAYSLLVDGEAVATSVTDNSFPVWLIPYVAPRVTIDASVSKATFAWSDAWVGKQVQCAVLAYANHATGMIFASLT